MDYSNVTVILSQIELVPSVLWIVTILYYVFRDWEENHLLKLGYICAMLHSLKLTLRLV